MAQYSGYAGTTTDLATNQTKFAVSSMSLDSPQDQEETYYDWPTAPKYLGYYKTIPELRSAINALAIWTAGKGYATNPLTMVDLEHISGWGEDTFQSIMENMIIQKKIFGDAFCEIVRDDDGNLLNLKPLFAGDMRVVVNRKGIIIRYEQRTGTANPPKKFDPEEILHICNDRVANEIHGTSVIESCQWVIDAKNEAMQDNRKIEHRNLALGIAYYDTDDRGEITFVNTKIENAVKTGEMLGLPKDTVEIREFPTKTMGDRLAWIQYLDNFFYQALGVPRVIASSQEYSEASSKVGFLTFEPVYTREQTLLEADLWNQLGIRIKFNRPPSLGSFMQESEQKNTGQTGFQANEVEVSAGRTE